MPGELVTALVAIVIALLGAGVSVYTLRAQARQAREQAQLDKAEQAARLMSRYRDPLIHAAFDLQSRLYNILRQDFLGKYDVRGTPTEREYAIESTLYVIGQYLGWVEILRREVQFLDLQDVEENRAWTGHLHAVSEAFFSDAMDPVFRAFRGEQRAIGEVMIASLDAGEGRHECIGYAMFVSRRDDPSFSRWFDKLRGDIDILAHGLAGHRERLVRLHSVLIDLIRHLDRDALHFPREVLSKLEPEPATEQPIHAGSSPTDGEIRRGSGA